MPDTECAAIRRSAIRALLFHAERPLKLQQPFRMIVLVKGYASSRNHHSHAHFLKTAVSWQGGGRRVIDAHNFGAFRASGQAICDSSTAGDALMAHP